MQANPSYRRRGLRVRLAVYGLLALGLVVIMLWGERLAPYDPYAASMTLEAIDQPPSAAHWMGTDNLGRDITGAKMAGIGANILFISPEKLAKKTVTDENRPDHIVHQFRDILDLPILQ